MALILSGSGYWGNTLKKWQHSRADGVSRPANIGELLLALTASPTGCQGFQEVASQGRMFDFEQPCGQILYVYGAPRLLNVLLHGGSVPER